MGLLLISSMMVLGGAYLILAFVWWLLQIIANWRIFTKAGEPGWKSIIPVYGDYISYKIAFGVDPYHFLKVCNIASTAYLPHAGNAWLNGDSCSMVKFVLLQFILQDRSGP